MIVIVIVIVSRSLRSRPRAGPWDGFPTMPPGPGALIWVKDRGGLGVSQNFNVTLFHSREVVREYPLNKFQTAKTL